MLTPKYAKSTKTTVSGFIAAIALVLTAVSDSLMQADGGDWTYRDTGLVIAAIAVGLQGLFSRDDNVTSEGTKRPKS